MSCVLSQMELKIILMFIESIFPGLTSDLPQISTEVLNENLLKY